MSNRIPRSYVRGMASSGVIKAGGACVAMDTTLPEDRLRVIVGQVSASIILSSVGNEDLSHRLADHPTVVVAPKHLEVSISTSGPRSLPKVAPFSPIYVVFTSGSTGTPKGVVILHRNFCSAIAHQQAALGFEKTSRVYDFASYAFDVAWSNFLNTMTCGGCLCIPSNVARRDDIAGSMNAMEITFAHLTPSVARLVDPSAVPSLTTVVLIGEPVAQEDVTSWSSRVILRNDYGPAECTPSATLTMIDPQLEFTGSIGHGLGLVPWVVRGDGQDLASVGTVGELWLEGPLVGQGYINDPEKTAAAFVDDPPWLRHGSSTHNGRRGRLYRAGDLVRYDVDGSLVFIGRNDSQVKIRGQRVELGEVETHVQQGLADYGMAARMVVELITPLANSNPVLVAFVSFSRAREDSLGVIGAKFSEAVGRLEKKLAKTVPTSMIPVAYIPMDKFPMTATGKTDRRQLQEMGAPMTLEHLATLKPSRAERRPPETAMEHKLQDLWATLLAIDTNSISADDSFLRVGGDSMQAMRLVGAAREQGLSLTVADVFKHPRLCDLAEQVGLNGGHVDMIIEPFSLLQSDIDADGARARAATLCCLDQEQIEDIFPCTPLQEGLIAMTSKRAGDCVARMAFELDENIDMDQLEAAWQDVAATVPILRTRIIHLTEQGLVRVVVNEPLRWVTGYNDVWRYIAHDKEQRMELGSPLSWVGVVEAGLSGKRFVLWTLHHALFDGWSLPLMLGEMKRVYCGMPQRWQAPFQSFVRHILEMNDDQAFSYWRAEMAGCQAVVFPELPQMSYQPQANQVVQHRVTDLRWPRGDITASTIVRGAWSLLIARQTDSNDVVFGATVTGRQAAVPGVEKMIGPTIVTVPVRVVLDWATSVKDLLHQIQNQALEMTMFEQTGLQRIRCISSEVEQSSQFQTLLVIQPREQEEGGSVYEGVFKSTETDANVVNRLGAFNTYAMMVLCQLEASGFDLQISFDPAVLSATQVRRLSRRLEFVLRQLCIEAGQSMKIKDIDILSKQDLSDIWTWNATVPEAAEDCMHDLITEMVHKQPEALAIFAWDGRMTYGELDALSTQLAHQLIGLGVNSEVIVPLCFEKSMWTTVAMIGVMKAGAASVAMDVNQPEARLRTIIQQVKSILILSSTANEQLAGRLGNRVIVVDMIRVARPWSLANQQLPVVSPSDRLYVVFTSGSTGTPKGAVITHSNFSSAVRHQQHAHGFGPSSRVYEFASYAFDAVWSTALHTLTCGGCLCIPSDSDRRNNLVESMKYFGVTHAGFTPTTARLLRPTDVPCLQTLFLAGEPITTSDVTTWTDAVDLRTGYGPAECTVLATSVNHYQKSFGYSYIGRGTGVVTWVIDIAEGARLTPVGAVGELWLEGPLVGAGYLNDFEKTAAAFIQDPPWLLRGGPACGSGRRGRLYRTGDLVRYNSDRTLEFIGRKDSQVKIRGQRVELHDVEHHIHQNIACGEAVRVVAEVITPQKSSDAMLVAFVQVGKEAGASDAKRQATLKIMTAQLDERLVHVLPAYMVPTSYILIDLPLTGTGKTDRQQLRKIGSSLTLEQLAALYPSRGKRRAPTTEMERRLRDLWATVIGIDANSIGLNDSFLRIGGDSIMAMRLVGVAREQNISLTVADVFQQPRLHELASILSREARPGEGPVEPFSLLKASIDVKETRGMVAALCDVKPDQVEDVFPCTPLQAGLLALTAKRPGDYILRAVMELRASVDVDRFREAWEVVVATTPILRTRMVDLVGQGLVQVIVSEQVQWLPVCVNEQQTMGLCTQLTQFGLVEEPGNNRRYFSCTMHHALYDGWSIALLMEKVEKIYLGTMPAPSLPFQAFVRYITNMDTDRVTALWREQLEGSQALAFPALPSTDYQPKTDMRVIHRIEGLQWLKSDITAATAVRAAWSILMARYTGSNEAIFGATVMGRQAEVSGIEHMVGPTIATVPLRVALGHQSVKELLLQVQRQAIEMTAIEQMGLQQIRRISPEVERGSRFQTLLVMEPIRERRNEQDILFKYIERTKRKEQEQELGGQAISRLGNFNSYALTMECQLEEQGLELNISFDSGVIDGKRVEKMVHQLEHVLQQVCAPENAATSLAEVETVSELDLGDIWNWNATIPEAVEACAHDLIAETVYKQPETLAVFAWDGKLTYSELDVLSTQLAYQLAELGVKLGFIVPLCFEKSMWTPVAMIGVMKAGGASVTMDSSQPEARLRTIMQ